MVSEARWHLPIQHTWLQSQKQELHEEKASTREDPAWETISIHIILISRAPTAQPQHVEQMVSWWQWWRTPWQDSKAARRFFWQNSEDWGSLSHELISCTQGPQVNGSPAQTPPEGNMAGKTAGQRKATASSPKLALPTQACQWVYQDHSVDIPSY